MFPAAPEVAASWSPKSAPAQVAQPGEPPTTTIFAAAQSPDDAAKTETPELVTPAPMAPTRIIATAPPPAPEATLAAKAQPQPKPIRVTEQPVVAKPTAGNPIKTGSVLAGAGKAGLLIASGPTFDSVRVSWNVLSHKYGPVLGSLEPRILPASDGSAFHLIAGPFATEADAQKACATLKTQGVGCRPTEFTGAAL